jgi:hypothetical protein
LGVLPQGRLLRLAHFAKGAPVQFARFRTDPPRARTLRIELGSALLLATSSLEMAERALVLLASAVTLTRARIVELALYESKTRTSRDVRARGSTGAGADGSTEDTELCSVLDASAVNSPGVDCDCTLNSYERGKSSSVHPLAPRLKTVVSSVPLRGERRKSPALGGALVTTVMDTRLWGVELPCNRQLRVKVSADPCGSALDAKLSEKTVVEDPEAATNFEMVPEATLERSGRPPSSLDQNNVRALLPRPDTDATMLCR